MPIHTLHYITLHYTTLRYATLHYTTVQYSTLHYITYIHTYIHIYIWYSYSDVYTTYDIYRDTQCIHIYYVHIWNQLGAAPAGCAWWLWHCSVDSGPCKRLNSQCHGSILISEEKYISSIKLWTERNPLLCRDILGISQSVEIKVYNRKYTQFKVSSPKVSSSKAGILSARPQNTLISALDRSFYVSLPPPLFFPPFLWSIQKIMVLQGSHV